MKFNFNLFSNDSLQEPEKQQHQHYTAALNTRRKTRSKSLIGRHYCQPPSAQAAKIQFVNRQINNDFIDRQETCGKSAAVN